MPEYSSVPMGVVVSSEKSWESLGPLQPVPLHRLVLDKLYELMHEGQLQLGDLLPSERLLAEKLNVSRGTLREAFRILEHEGIIETRGGGGRRLRRALTDDISLSPEAYMNSLRRSAAIDLMEARQALEERIVELACERATDADISNIREALDASKPVTEEVESDTAFHIAIAAATHNFVFVRMMRVHLDLVKGIRSMILTPERREQMHEEHQAIFEAIATRDAERARAAMIRHRQNVIHHLQGNGRS